MAAPESVQAWVTEVSGHLWPRSRDCLGPNVGLGAATKGAESMHVTRIVRDLRKSYWASTLRIVESTSLGAQYRGGGSYWRGR